MIPENISAVAPAWLSDCMGQQVVDFTLTQIGQGVGIMGDIFQVGLQYHAEVVAPASVVVKLPSSFEENRAQGVALGMFEAEVRFYRELAGNLQVGLPKIYHADIEPGTANFVIVMEDLSHLTTVPQALGMSASQARAAVTVLAHVHATWWDRVQTPELEWIPSMVSERIQQLDPVLVQLLPAFLDGFGQHLPPGGREIYEAFAGNYLKLTTVFAQRSPWTLAHQDYRVENLLFGSQPNADVVVLDWQGIGRGPGAYDLAYVLSGSMSSDIRRQAEADLLQAYHQQLVALGVSGYGLDALKEDYALAQLMGGLATPLLIGGGMDLSNDRGVELIATMAGRHVTAALDHQGLDRLLEIAG